MTPNQLQDYFNRSGDNEIIPNCEYLVNDYGFMSYRVEKDTFIIVQVYGDGKYWDEKANRLAKQFGLIKIMFSTKRNPKTFERKYGYRVTGYVMEKGVE